MHARAASIFAAAFLFVAPIASHAALVSYTQNFESMVKSNPNALSNDGWIVYGNVFTSGNAFLYGYGPYPAPNGTSAFCAVDTLQGGPLQGNLQLSVYSDYNNTGAHSAGDLVESNVYHEQTVGAGDVGGIWTFQFDAKLGNLVSPSTAMAFIKTINPSAGYAMTNLIDVNTTAIPATWNTYSISITVDASLVGQLMQFGFENVASHFVSSGVFYDNLVWSKTGGVGVDPTRVSALELRGASPNPFAGTTRIDYSLAQRGGAQISVYDVGGRRVATLLDNVVEAGPHSVVWDGLAADGRKSPSGIYLCTLRTAGGSRTARMVLSR